MTDTARLDDQANADTAVRVLLAHLDADGPRQALKQASESIRQRFYDGESVVDLVHLKATVVDELLRVDW